MKTARRGRPPGSTSDATRQRILAAACEAFGKAGYDGTTNREIGDLAGVTAAAMYQYFDSKLVLYVECVREAHRTVVPFFESAVTGAPTAREGLSALGRAYTEAHERFPEYSRFLAGVVVEVHRHEEIARALENEPNTAMQVVAALVNRGVETGEIPRERAASVTALWLANMMGLALLAARTGKAGLASAVEAHSLLVEGRLFEDPKDAKRGPRRRSRR